MATHLIRRGAIAMALAAAVAMAGTPASASATYTNQFRGEGSSSFGFAWYYARWDARRQAEADGFTDTANQCKEIFTFGNNLSALVIWECTREI